MGEPKTNIIINNSPDLSYKPKKRKLEEYESIVEKGDLEKSISLEEYKSNADIVYDKLDNVSRLAEEVDLIVDNVCKDIAYNVDMNEEPIVYNALSRLFGDDFTGTMTWGMYAKLIKLNYLILDDSVKDSLNVT
jgi:hypothetical protein